MKWETVKLGDVINLKRGYDLPNSCRKEGSIPVVSSSGITGFHNIAKVQSPGVVTGRYGTLGEVYFIDSDFWPLNTSLYVQNFKGNNPRFVTYFLKYSLRGTTSDKAAVPGINRNDLHAREVLFPKDTKVQEKIADILSKYDDLIENNRRRIELLEESARLLYREWFVYLRFPGHEHISIIDGFPEGWEEKTLGEVGYLNYGKALKEDARIPGNYPVFGSSGVIGTHNKFLVEAPGIIVGRKGSIGSVFWSSENYYPIDTTYFINAQSSNLYLYYTLLTKKFMSTDAAVPGLNRDFAHSVKILIPNRKYFDLFNDFVQPVYNQISHLKKYNSKLQKARDLILPRLMNGEIAV